ncbi:MAG: hypothetical protein JKY95_16465 [Planctomycetaceae bacterium]|nr:hypothetical protein [Planctomycetaceae bacterium]
MLVSAYSLIYDQGEPGCDGPGGLHECFESLLESNKKKSPALVPGFFLMSFLQSSRIRDYSLVVSSEESDSSSAIGVSSVAGASSAAGVSGASDRGRL